MLYMIIGRLIETTPDFSNKKITDEQRQWFGRVYAVIKESGGYSDEIMLNHAITNLTKYISYEKSPEKNWCQSYVGDIKGLLYKVLGFNELHAPVSPEEIFFPVGGVFDFFVAISKIFDRTKKEILIVDSYLDNKILTEFALTIPENVTIKLLTSKKAYERKIIQPALNKWVKQYGNTRPIELRIVSNRLHDRWVIIDNKEVWTLSQSFNNFSARSEGKIIPSQKPHKEIEVCSTIWKDAELIKP